MRLRFSQLNHLCRAQHFYLAFISETRDQLMSIRTFSTVPRVASNPTMPFAVRRAAGLIAGTTPTTGKSNFSRNAGSETVLAVLQATTASAKGITFLHCGDNFHHSLNNKHFAFFRHTGKRRYQSINVMEDPVRDAGSRHRPTTHRRRSQTPARLGREFRR